MTLSVTTAPEPYYYHWRNMPMGVKKPCPSPIDAVVEVLMHELGLRTKTLTLDILGIEFSSLSRVRNKKQPLPHFWLIKASLLSGIPYLVICELAGEKPQHEPHPRAWKSGFSL